MPKSRPSNILLTGGTGYIGSHVAVALLEAGHSVFLYDNLNNSRSHIALDVSKLGGVEAHFKEGDILDDAKLYEIFSYHKIDTVIHFAGLKSVAESVEHPTLYQRVNLRGSESLLRAMDKAGIYNLLYSSTALVYEATSSALQETDRTMPANPYGAYKLAVERILERRSSSDVSYCSLRYFNPVGAHSSGLLGESPTGRPNNLVPLLMESASGGKPLSVFGNDYDTPDGTCIRDYIHIDDVVSGHLSALEFIWNNKGYDCFNLGTGRGVSVAEMLSAFEEATGVKVPHSYAPRRAGDVASLTADPTKANKILGWKATGTIPDMLKSAWKWHCHKS